MIDPLVKSKVQNNEIMLKSQINAQSEVRSSLLNIFLKIK